MAEINAMIPLQAGKPTTPMMGPMDIAKYKQMMYGDQLTQMQLAEAQRGVQSQNAMRTALSQPGAIGDNGMSPEAFQAIAQADPMAAITLRNTMAKQVQEQQERQTKMEADKARSAKDRQELQMKEHQDFLGRVQPIMSGMLSKYDDGVKRGLPMEQVQRSVMEYKIKAIDEAENSGELTKQQAEMARKGGFDPDKFRMQLRMLGASKGEGPQTEVAKAKEDLDAGRITKEQFDAVVKKATSTAADNKSGFSKEADEYSELVAKGLGNTPKAVMLKKHLDKMDAPPAYIINNNTGGAAAPKAASGKSGEEFLKALPDSERAIVKKLGDYDLNPQALSTKGGHREHMINLAAQYNPDFDDTKYAEKRTGLNEFQRKKGDAVRFLNVSIDHIDTAAEYAKALKNGDLQRLNKLKNWWQTETGQTAPNTFDGIKDIVASEVIKGAIGGPGGVEERRDNAAKVKNASSPQQLEQLFNGWKKLMAGQMKGLEKAYESGTGSKNFREKYMLPRARAALEEVSGEGYETSAGSASPAHPPEIQSLLKKYGGK